MSSLSTIWVKTETLKTILDTLEKKGDKGIELTMSIDDKTNQYGQNLSAFISQTKEQREAKKPRFYVGNGKVVWSDGKITVAEKQGQTAPAMPQSNEFEDDTDDLPF